MLYRNGYDFERAVFGRSFEGRPDRSLERSQFGFEARDLVEAAETECPQTQIGGCLHHQVLRQLDSPEFGINSGGVIFLSTVGTKLDCLGVDGLFFVPLLFPYLVTVDTYNIHETQLRRLKESWIDSFDGQDYFEGQFQSDLFLYKAGKARWREENKESLKKGEFVPEPTDFRKLALFGREKNHYVLTPKGTSTYEGRRNFARLVAGHFAKIAKESSHQDMALLSH